MRMVTYAMLIVVAQSAYAHADMPTPTCEQMKAGYDQLASAPISAEDGSLEIAVNALADNKLLAHDATRTEYASRERIASYLKTLSPLDALVWVFNRYDELENAMRRNKCDFSHKDIVLKSPAVHEKPGKARGGPQPDLSKTPR